MKILYSIILAAIAGLMNGSYAFPIKNIKKTWPTDCIWMSFSVFAFLLLPWITNIIINPKVITLLLALPNSMIALEIIAGFMFGIGMVLFTFSLNYIGIGISFLLNIAISTIIATLLPIVIRNPGLFTQLFGLLELAAMILFIFAIIASIKALNIKNQYTNTPQQYVKGIVLGIFSGIFVASQGFTYAYSLPTIKMIANLHQASPFSAANISWIFLFNGAFIPYFLFFLFKNIKQNQLKIMKTNPSANLFWIFIMANLNFDCLLIFGKATLLAGNFGGVISWPMLMIFIILTSNFWGAIQGEWTLASHVAKKWLFTSIVLMILAILILGYNGYKSLH